MEEEEETKVKGKKKRMEESKLQMMNMEDGWEAAGESEVREVVFEVSREEEWNKAAGQASTQGDVETRSDTENNGEHTSPLHWIFTLMIPNC